MSLYDRGEPAANQRFRANTDKADQMLNVQLIPDKLLCVDCRRYRTRATGAMKKRGFVCGMCHSPRVGS